MGANLYDRIHIKVARVRRRNFLIALLFLIAAGYIFISKSSYNFNINRDPSGVFWQRAAEESRTQLPLRSISKDARHLPPYFFGYHNDWNYKLEDVYYQDPYYLPTARCAVSDKYKFIFIFTHKGGSTTIRQHFHDEICKKQGRADDQCRLPWYNYIGGLTYQGNKCDRCIDIPRWKFAQYFVFGVVRNPWARVVSAYKFCRLQHHNISWSEFCKDPRLDSRCRTKHSPMETAEREKGLNEHWAPQAPRFCAKRDGSSCIVDFIGKTDDMAKDLNTVIIPEINRRRNSDAPEIGRIAEDQFSNKQAASKSRYTSWYMERPTDAEAQDPSVQYEPDCKTSIEKFYKDDVELFGFEFGKGD